MQQANTTARPPRLLMQKLRVPLGFLAGIAYLVSAKPFLWSMLLGFPIALLGLAIRAWASGHLRKGMELATSGPYAHCRNPLYFGSFVMALGCALAGRSVAPGALLVGFFLLLYWRVMHAEAAQMRARFGDEYRAAIGLLAVMSILCVKTVAPFPR